MKNNEEEEETKIILIFVCEMNVVDRHIFYKYLYN